MNKLILNRIIKRITNKNDRLLISSLSYYSILALIPTILLTTLILKTFNIPIYIKYQSFFNLISINFISNFFIVIITIYMISRVFLLLLKKHFSTIKSLSFSIALSISMIIFLTLFFTSYTIANSFFSNTIRFILIMLFFLTISLWLSTSSFKYSLLFSIFYSIISNIFLQIFFYFATFFSNYEKVYGILSPMFIIILAIHLFIYITHIIYITSEEFTKISKIKFIKR